MGEIMRIKREFYLLISILIFTNVRAGNLTCSMKGTHLLHLPGAFTSTSEQSRVEKELQTISDVNSLYIDQKKLFVSSVPIPSQGILMDNFNYFMMSSPPGIERDLTWLTIGALEFGFSIKNDIVAVTKVGGVLSKVNRGGAIVTKMRGTVKNGKFIVETVKKREIVSATKLIGTGNTILSEGFESIKDFLRVVSSQDNNYDPSTFLGKVFGLIDIENPAIMGRNILNTVSLAKLESKFNLDFFFQHRDTYLATYFTTEKNINNIAGIISSKLNENKKVIISAHGEGNQLVESAIAQLYGIEDVAMNEKLTKYLSVVATSPTTNQYSNKYFYMKHNFDKRQFGGSDVINNYVLNNNSLPGDSQANSKDSRYGFSFLDFYASPIVIMDQLLTRTT
jgi:hypothetical protein